MTATRRFFALFLVLSCGGGGDGDDSTSTGPAPSSSEVGSSSSTTDPATTDPSTTDPATTDPSTSASTTGSSTTDASSSEESTAAADESTGAHDESLGCAYPEEHDTTDGNAEPLMETWGAACTNDAECVELIGDGGVCVTQALLYELPNGYCTKLCSLPDALSHVALDDPYCSADGGVACIGQQGVLEICAVLCTDDAQCNRDGYVCRQMPLLAALEDPSVCLMPDCCLDSCTDE